MTLFPLGAAFPAVTIGRHAEGVHKALLCQFAGLWAPFCCIRIAVFVASFPSMKFAKGCDNAVRLPGDLEAPISQIGGNGQPVPDHFTQPLWPSVCYSLIKSARSSARGPNSSTRVASRKFKRPQKALLQKIRPEPRYQTEPAWHPPFGERQAGF